jgi:hypothetical protein
VGRTTRRVWRNNDLGETTRVRNVRPALAIIRIDRYSSDEQERVTVKRVVWDETLAVSEVQRLNELNEDSETFYFWQYTRVDELR